MSEGLTYLLETLWSELHLLNADLICLLHHNARERCVLMDLAEQYTHMHFLRRLSLDLKLGVSVLRKRQGTLPLPECHHYAYIYSLAYESPYSTYMGVH